jgi:ABC-type molybdate transport system substrate-binding protein
VEKNYQIKNNLSWITQSELNTDYFILERSKDGQNFEELTKIKAAGNSSALLRYTSSDYYPFETITYYRLKQVDNDGKFSYSKIISLLGSRLNFALVKHYPNPAKAEVFFYFLLEENKSFQLENYRYVW